MIDAPPKLTRINPGLLFFFALLLVFAAGWVGQFDRRLVPFVVGPGLVVLGVELLLQCLPTAIRRTLIGNAIRSDGSISRRRLAIEREALLRLRMSMWCIGLFVVLPLCFLAAWLLTRNGMEQILGLPDASLQFAADAEPPKLLRPAPVPEPPPATWENYPAFSVAAGVLVWLIVGFILFQSLYLRELKELWRGARDRQQYYRAARQAS